MRVAVSTLVLVTLLASAGAASAAPHDTTLVSRAPGGAKANGQSTDGAVSGDGRYVAFWSSATNLSSDDGDTMFDLYRRDLVKNEAVLVSRASGPNGAKATTDAFIDGPAISSDGRLIAFVSNAPNLSRDDPDGRGDVFLRDVDSLETILVSRASGASGAKSDRHSFAPAISGDGRFVAFSSTASNLTPEQPAQQQVYVRDLQTRTTTLVSRATGAAGAPAARSAGFPVISADGRFVAFSTAARNLGPEGRDNVVDVYVRDRLRDTTTLVSRASGKNGAKGLGASRFPAISADGRFVAFSSSASLSPADDGTNADVYMRDLGTSTTTLVSRATGAAGALGDADSSGAAISGDGQRVAFVSQATNLSADDVDVVPDVFVRDTVANTTALLSRAGGAARAAGNGVSDRAAISADGRFVAFGSRATNLSLADPVPDYDQYVRELPSLARPPLVAVKVARAVPTRLWYRLRISYAGKDVSEVTRHAPGVTGDVRTVHLDAAAKLRPQSAVLLRRRPGRTFSVLPGRELTGRLIRFNFTIDETLPHCSVLQHQLTGVQLGRISGSFGFEPVGRDRVELLVGGNATTQQLAGMAAINVTRPAWMCDFDALQRDGFPFLPEPFWRGRLLSPPLTLPRIIGREAESSESPPGFRALRTALSSLHDQPFAIRVRGARFGAQRFIRTVRLDKLIPIETASESGHHFAGEDWKLTFTRCPRPRPCE